MVEVMLLLVGDSNNKFDFNMPLHVTSLPCEFTQRTALKEISSQNY